MTFAEIRQQVLSQLSPAMDRAEIPALLHTLAYIALHDGAEEAATAMLTGGPDRQDRSEVETTLSGLEASWSEEIDALRAEIIRQHGLAGQASTGSETVLALLQREFTDGPTA
jgi:hypothetical protein